MRGLCELALGQLPEARAALEAVEERADEARNAAPLLLTELRSRVAGG